MLVVCDPGAKERPISEHRALLESVGFRDVEHRRITGPRDIVIARKP
jgi:hypothetical protein